ncbi:MAG: PfkB family carbohydrate kinase, partial [Alphaproteobacteria bacterium]
MTAVACVGIAVLDIVFSVDELPSAAGKYYAREYREIGGGVAANAAATVTALGGHARYVGRVGDDAVGQRILAELRDWDVDTTHVEQVAGCGSSVSAVLVDRTGERLIVNHVDPRLFGNGARLDGGALAGMDAVLVDTRWPDGAEAALSATAARGAPAVLDCDRAPASEGDRLLKAASHVVFSETALTELAGVDVLD